MPLQYLPSLPQTLGLDFTREEVNHVIGLLEVNAFQVTLDAKEVKEVEEKKDEKMKGSVAREGLARGVFPLLAMLNHSCTSNARWKLGTLGSTSHHHHHHHQVHQPGGGLDGVQGHHHHQGGGGGGWG